MCKHFFLVSKFSCCCCCRCIFFLYRDVFLWLEFLVIGLQTPNALFFLFFITTCRLAFSGAMEGKKTLLDVVWFFTTLDKYLFCIFREKELVQCWCVCCMAGRAPCVPSTVYIASPSTPYHSLSLHLTPPSTLHSTTPPHVTVVPRDFLVFARVG